MSATHMVLLSLTFEDSPRNCCILYVIRTRTLDMLALSLQLIRTRTASLKLTYEDDLWNCCIHSYMHTHHHCHLFGGLFEENALQFLQTMTNRLKTKLHKLGCVVALTALLPTVAVEADRDIITGDFCWSTQNNQCKAIMSKCQSDLKDSICHWLP